MTDIILGHLVDMLKVTVPLIIVVVKLHYDKKKQNKEISEIKAMSNSIKEYSDYSEALKSFKPKMKAYYIALISSLKIKERTELVKFLKTGSSSALDVFQEILNVGFKDFKDWNYEIIENDFSDKEIYLRSTFECKKLGIDKGKLEKIINNERNEFMFKLKPIVEKKTNGERLDEFKKLCKSFIENTIRKINDI